MRRLGRGWATTRLCGARDALPRVRGGRGRARRHLGRDAAGGAPEDTSPGSRLVRSGRTPATETTTDRGRHGPPSARHRQCRPVSFRACDRKMVSECSPQAHRRTIPFHVGVRRCRREGHVPTVADGAGGVSHRSQHVPPSGEPWWNCVLPSYTVRVRVRLLEERRFDPPRPVEVEHGG
jgi:hypothetical protein